MTQRFIGMVDLTVRHSSMNPLSYIDVHDANTAFERLVVRACKITFDDAENEGVRADLLAQGIVREGPAAKFFHFRTPNEMLIFITNLRSMLIDGKLPFKMCVRVGDLSVSALPDIWDETIAAAKAGDEDASNRLLEEFDTTDEGAIREIYKLYRAPGFDRDAINLGVDFETFKGFGISIDEGALASLVGHRAKLFHNHFPSKASAASGGAFKYIDCRFAVDEADLIARFIVDAVGEEPAGRAGTRRPQQNQVVQDVLAAGAGSQIGAIFKLLARSVTANPENAVYYVSILTTIVRSSFYRNIAYLDSATVISGRTRAPGWQDYPPIFQALLLDPENNKLLKRVPGIEFLLGALVDEVFAALGELPSSATVSEDDDLRDLGIERNDSELKEWRRRMAQRERHVNEDVRFKKMVLLLKAIYGDAVLRRILTVPSTVLTETRQRAVLAVASGD